MMKKENKSAPPTQRRSSITLLCMKIWSTLPISSTQRQENNPAAIAEKSRLVWKVNAVKAITTVKVIKRASITRTTSYRLTTMPIVHACTTVNSAKRIKFVGCSLLLKCRTMRIPNVAKNEIMIGHGFSCT